MKNETDALSEAISLLNQKREKELDLLKEQFRITYESLNPINLIKNTFREATSSPEIRRDILGSAVGLGTGFLSRKLWIGKSNHPIKRLFGIIIQFAITNVVSKHADGIKTKGQRLLYRYLKNRKPSKREYHDYSNNLS